MVLPRKHYFRPCLFFLRHAHVYSDVGCNHYKTLGLSPSATKGEIKAAYYELSKKHHPDRNKGSDESAKIFRRVREAYEILGNEHKRMTYDRERIFNFVRKPVSNCSPDNSPDYKDDVERIHFHSRARTPFRRYSYGKTAYYDFDTWYECHYGNSAKEEYHFKTPKQFKYQFRYNYEYKPTKEDNQLHSKVKFLMIFFFSIMCVLSSVSWLNGKRKKR